MSPFSHSVMTIKWCGSSFKYSWWRLNRRVKPWKVTYSKEALQCILNIQHSWSYVWVKTTKWYLWIQNLHIFQNIMLMRVLVSVTNKRNLNLKLDHCPSEGLFKRNGIESKGTWSWVGKKLTIFFSTLNLTFRTSLNKNIGCKPQ